VRRAVRGAVRRAVRRAVCRAVRRAARRTKTTQHQSTVSTQESANFKLRARVLGLGGNDGWECDLESGGMPGGSVLSGVLGSGLLEAASSYGPDEGAAAPVLATCSNGVVSRAGRASRHATSLQEWWDVGGVFGTGKEAVHTDTLPPRPNPAQGLSPNDALGLKQQMNSDRNVANRRAQKNGTDILDELRRMQTPSANAVAADVAWARRKQALETAEAARDFQQDAERASKESSSQEGGAWWDVFGLSGGTGDGKSEDANVEDAGGSNTRSCCGK